MSESDRWRISVDTGGTFTDCLATSPTGVTTRHKVLSSSAVRGRVVGRPDETTAVVEWGVPSGVLDGAELRVRPADGASGPSDAPKDESRSVIASHDSERIVLAAPLGVDSMPPGASFEVQAPWSPPILAARIATRTPAHADLPAIDMRLATTRGTNALLERRGHPPVLFITAGFGDLLEIGDQSRPDLFALDIVKPAPLHAMVIEVPERLDVSGAVLEALDLASVRPGAEAALAAGHTTAAVALLHSWANPIHERALAAMLREVGFEHVCASADLSPLIGFLARTQSAVVDAYLSRVVGDYLAAVRRGLGPRGRLRVMTSAGGLASADEFHPKDSLLSGPAGGLLGAAWAGQRAGRERIITFDMGGTSTDVARCASTSTRAFPLLRQHRVGDARVVAPAVGVETVAAGGGSICSFDSGELRVGPESAGASPGPACYGAGGPLTVTDCHLLLGRLAPERFGIPIHVDAARRRADGVLAEVNAHQADAGGASMTLEALLEGFLTLADERMADAIRRISIRQGEDPASYALVAFGGAGGLHACALAERLGVRDVVVPPEAGVLSARGLAVARVEHAVQRQVLRAWEVDSVDADDEAAAAQVGMEAPPAWLVGLLDELAAEAIAGVVGKGVDASHASIVRREARVRVPGQSATLDVDAADAAAIPALFAAAYERTFGHTPATGAIEIESLLVVAAGRAVSPGKWATEAPPEARTIPRAGDAGTGDSTSPIRVYCHGAWREGRRVERDRMRPGRLVPGPAIISEPHATTFVPVGWSASADASGAAVMVNTSRPERNGSPGDAAAVADASADSPVALELFVAALTAIAEDMGEMLRRTALSVNVRERLDFSCALLSPDGQLLVNAPHIPVHLGAMGLCVRALQGAIELAPGDTVITNHPAFGGSHLPDVTLVTPIHADTPGGPRLIAFAASRAHHAEIGGVSPGSMPVGATRLSEEGVVIRPTHLVRDGRAQFDAIERLLRAGPHPSRSVEQNMADIRAALAANRHAHRAVCDLFSRTGLERAGEFCGALTARAESRMRAALGRIAPGVYEHADGLDDATPIVARITVHEARCDSATGTGEAGPAATIDLGGSGGVHGANYNATRAITTAAVLYTLRVLAGEDMPLNEGLLRAIDLRIPTGTLLDPGDAWAGGDGPAVAAGNVETSQRIVDVLLLAMGLAAASQGTMNNVAFGNDEWGCYETICGGAGATPRAPGASGVHTHMTNTRITDAEVLEQRLPVRVRRFGIRCGSGGDGAHRGGDGVVREFEFLESVRCSILAQRRPSGPPGLGCGGAGAVGAQSIWEPDGGWRIIKAGAFAIPSGGRLRVSTPGGGGWR
ncbi:MAG: hydantoinase B/oxoprolinase family protein [Phycisphaerales bacterium]